MRTKENRVKPRRGQRTTKQRYVEIASAWERFAEITGIIDTGNPRSSVEHDEVIYGVTPHRRRDSTDECPLY